MNMYESLVVKKRKSGFGKNIESHPYILKRRRFDNPVEVDYTDICIMTRAQAIAVVSTNLADSMSGDLKEFQGKAVE